MEGGDGMTFRAAALDRFVFCSDGQGSQMCSGRAISCWELSKGTPRMGGFALVAI